MSDDVLDRPADAADDPWGTEPAIVKPTPGGRSAGADAPPLDPAAPVAAPPAPTWRPAEVLRQLQGGRTAAPPIVAGAVPLLNLAYELRSRPGRPDAGALREATFAAVKTYERELAAARIPPERARAAHYAVCATVDDVILSRDETNGDAGSDWARSGLVSTFHMDVTGGERVFDLLDHFHRDPGSNRDILLLLYLCLSLGFEGRTRVSARGALELAQTREGLYRTLRAQFGAFERELSPHWRGVAARHKPLRTATALWALGGAAVLLLALGYLVATLAIGRASDETMTRLASVAAAAPPSLAIVERAPPVEVAKASVVPPASKPAETATEPAPQPTPGPTPEPPADPLAIFLGFLQPDVEAGRVSLTRKDDAVLVRIRNTGLFAPGSVAIGEDFDGLLNRIGAALASEDYRATVIGHTDDRPIRTVRFPSNWELSRARADAVAAVLRAYTGRAMVTAEGRADTEPVADNTSRAGREANRRTDILVHGRPPAADYKTREVDGRALLRARSKPDLVPDASAGATPAAAAPAARAVREGADR